MKRRRSGSRRRKGGGIRFKFIFGVLLLGALGWVGATQLQLWQKIETLPEVKGHDFIAYGTDSPVLVVAKQSAQAAQLESLIILKADLKQRTIAALELPVDLSDGTTTVAQYLESHYYKEMQLAIESQLALPLSGYMLQLRSDVVAESNSLADQIKFETPPSWWSTTIGLPLWLNDNSPITTNLSQWQLLQLSWLIRDLDLESTNLTQVPATAQKKADGQMQLVPDQIDPIVQDLFISDEVRKEAKSIVVKNATHVDGLAALVGRFVANMGGEVVAVEPADTAQTGSSVAAEKDTSLTRIVNQFLGIPTTIRPQTGRERADVELIIGTDALTRLGK